MFSECKLLVEETNNVQLQNIISGIVLSRLKVPFADKNEIVNDVLEKLSNYTNKKFKKEEIFIAINDIVDKELNKRHN